MDIRSYRWQQLRKRVLARDANQCVRCGSEEQLQCDHVIPRSRGGDDHMDNLQTLCQNCHSMKTNNDVQFLVRPKDPPLSVGNFSPKKGESTTHLSVIRRIKGDSAFLGNIDG